jgi:hypothetical protein
MTGFDQARQTAREIARIALPRAWPLPVVMAITAYIAFLVPDLDPLSSQPKVTALALSEGLFADCMTQTIGAFFAIVGMALGIVIMRSGFQTAPRRNQV